MTAMVGVLTLLFMAPTVSRADVIFTNFGGGLSYNTSNANSVGNAFDGNNYAQGDTFTSGVTESLQSLTIALSCFGPNACPDNFFVQLNANSAGAPGAALESFSVTGASLGLLGNNNAPLVLNSVLHPLLGAGTEYWVSVRSDLNDSIGWNLNTTGDISSEAISTDGGVNWFSPSGLTPGAYEVDGNSGAVPEPASVPVLASMIAVIGVLTWRRRKAGSVQVP
jgi:hypothetical protein